MVLGHRVNRLREVIDLGREEQHLPQAQPHRGLDPGAVDVLATAGVGRCVGLGSSAVSLGIVGELRCGLY